MLFLEANGKLWILTKSFKLDPLNSNNRILWNTTSKYRAKWVQFSVRKTNFKNNYCLKRTNNQLTGFYQSMVKNDINARDCAWITAFIGLLGRGVGSGKLNLSLNSGLVLNKVNINNKFFRQSWNLYNCGNRDKTFSPLFVNL